MVEQDLVEIRIRAGERKLRCFPVEDYLVCVRTKLYPAPEEFFEFRRPARPLAELTAPPTMRHQAETSATTIARPEPPRLVLRERPVGQTSDR